MIEEEDWDQESIKGRVALPNWMNFRKVSKQQLTPNPTPQNGPYLWKSCACISYYLVIISPRIYATISVMKICNIIFQKWGRGRRPFGIFSKNSSDLVAGPFPNWYNKYLWHGRHLFGLFLNATLIVRQKDKKTEREKENRTKDDEYDSKDIQTTFNDLLGSKKGGVGGGCCDFWTQWSKKICRPKIIVWSGATFILCNEMIYQKKHCSNNV